MSQNSYKPTALAEELLSRFKQRGFNPSLTFDTDGMPVVTYGPGTAGSNTVLVKVISWPTPLSRDSLGNVASVYTPDIMQVAVEAGLGTSPMVLDAVHMLPTFGDVLQFGCRVELWESANGTAPTTTTYAVATNMKAVWDSIKYPLLSTM